MRSSILTPFSNAGSTGAPARDACYDYTEVAATPALAPGTKTF